MPNMKKKAELVFTFLKLPLDFLALLGSGLLAYFIRYQQDIQEIRPIIFNLPFEKYLTIILIISASWLIFFGLSGLYKFTNRKITDELSRIFLACSTGMTAVIIYMFFIREYFSSRFIVLTAWILSIVFVSIIRLIIRKMQTYCLSHNIGNHNVVIFGANADSQAILQTLKKEKDLGYRVIAHFGQVDETVFDELEKLHEEQTIDEILQADSNISRAHSIQLLNFANSHNIIFKYAAGQFEARTTNVEVHMISGVPIVEIRKTKLDGWGKICKRLLDLILSSILIIVFSPLMLLITILIKIENKGPAIYFNERVTSKNKKFNTYKFRSMYSKFCIGEQFARYTDQAAALKVEQQLIAEKSKRLGPVYKVLNDPRRTRIGRLLEKTSLDELPQFFNVWLGNMSLVGPRPHQAREVDKYEDYQRHVLDIKPGVTGLAQISGRSDLDFDEEVKLDSYYIEN